MLLHCSKPSHFRFAEAELNSKTATALLVLGRRISTRWYLGEGDEVSSDGWRIEVNLWAVRMANLSLVIWISHKEKHQAIVVLSLLFRIKGVEGGKEGAKRVSAALRRKTLS